MLVECQAEQIHVAKALPDTSNSGRGVVGGGVAGRLLPHHHGHEQVSPLDTIALFLLDQSLRPGEPPRATRHLSPDQQVSAGPACAAGGLERLASLQMSVMRTLQDLQMLIVAAEHRRRCREQLEILSSQRQRPIGSRKRRVRASPFSPRVRLTPVRETLGSRVSCCLDRRHGDTLRSRAGP